MLKRILHTGLAVPNLKKAIRTYASLGFELDKQFTKDDLKADVAFVVKGETTFELFEFHDMEHEQVKFIKNHIAIYSDALDEDISSLLKLGYKLTIPITEGVIFRYAFVQDASGTNYEIASDKT